MGARQGGGRGEVGRRGPSRTYLDSLKQRVDLAQEVGRHAAVGPRGMAQCPFHEDATPSLHVDGKKGLYHCFGCQASGDIFSFVMKIESVPFLDAVARVAEIAGVGAWNLAEDETADQSDQTPPSPRRNGSRVAYDYRDESGTLLYQVLRERGKKFWQRRLGENGEWSNNVQGVRRVLYRLPELLSRTDEPVYLPEGEKDVDRLMAAGLLATTSCGGAGKWDESYVAHLVGRDVVILADNDVPGTADALKKARSLRGKAGSVRVIRFSELPKGGDVSDWLDQGRSIEDLKALALAAPEWSEAESASADGATSPGVGEIHNSDLGNARRLVADRGQDIRFVHPWKTWLIWDGIRWQRDETGEVVRMAKGVVSGLYAEAAKSPDSSDRKDLAKFAIRSEMEPRLRGMLSLARSEPRIPALPRALDTDPWLLGVQNGTVDLRNGELRTSDRKDLITKVCPVPFEPTATCPLWERFLNRIMEGSQDLVRFLQRAAGYSLTGSTEEQVMFLLYGLGLNGKSTFLEALRFVLGEYARQTESKTFLDRKDDSIRNDIARLAGVRLVTAVETERRRKLAESFVKQCTGGDTITARFLHQEYFEYEPTFKVWLATNHKPEIEGTDEGIWRRPKLIPFRATIGKEERDPKLPGKLKEEAPGILAWLVRGCLAWQAEGLGVPQEVAVATEEYRAENDVLAAFLDECCVLTPAATASATALYEAHAEWAKKRGEEGVNQRVFGTALGERGFAKDRGGTNGTVRYRGIGLRAT